MEEDNLPSGKSDWLLIKALCFLCWIEGHVCYSNMHLHLRKVWKINRDLGGKNAVIPPVGLSDKTEDEYRRIAANVNVINDNK